jgi:hypothetical protein
MHEFDVGAGAALMQRHPQRVQDERGAHVPGELAADHAPAVGVDDEGKEHYLLPAAQVGQVGDPELVRAAGAEVAVDEIGAAPSDEVRCRVAPRLAAALGAADPVGAHQPLDPATPGRFAGASQRLPHPSRSVGVVVRSVGRRDPAEQPLVLDRPRGAPAGSALVVGGRRHVQGPADRLDAEAIAMLVDERAHFGRSGSSSFAKYTDADLRISFARRSS